MMDNYCENCKHAHLETEEQKAERFINFINIVGRVPYDIPRYICDKIPKGKEWTNGEKTYTYAGYSIRGECYDEIFNCFEPKAESEGNNE